MTLRVMSAGGGYRYLLNSVAVGDGARDPGESLIAYYVERGTPPGRWVGTGLRGIAGGRIRQGDDVSELELRRLLGSGEDPGTGEPLGHRYRRYARVGVNPVAGFDLTMSVPKSVSALWAVADAGIQSLIVRAHHDTIAEIIDLVEREIAMTRVGANGVAQVEVSGVLATAYDHYDSRANDPHLHTHVVVANRVQAIRDGTWRTLDSRALHHSVVALSETYHALLADRLTRVLGVSWERRERGRDRNPAWEIAGVPDALVSTFSSRARVIDSEVARLIREWRTTHGRMPPRRQIIRLRQQAALMTRPDKTSHSMADLTARWRIEATQTLGIDAVAWARSALRDRQKDAVLRADDLPSEALDDIARSVVAAVADRRSTWRRWNLHAEAARATMGLRFATTLDREVVLGLVVDRAEDVSVRLSSPDLTSTPAEFRRADGSSAFVARHTTRFSSAQILAAEDRLLVLAEELTALTLDPDVVSRFARRGRRGRPALAADQEAALHAVAVSGRVVDLLVGPAGSGKTTALGALREAWETARGAGSVVGLAPSAAAADVLAGDLGIPTENTAKWLHEHERGSWTFAPGQLVIVDEASLAGTLALDRLALHARDVGAKVLLAGDWAQLAAVEAGGAFGMLVRARTLAPELFDIRRFVAAWEGEASRRLRVGDEDVLETYVAQGRILAAEHEAAHDAAYRAWLDDRREGRDSILIAPTIESVTQLNARARADLVVAGVVRDEGVALTAGIRAGVGDTIITRQNDRGLRTGTGWVKNGDRWQVTEARSDGSITVRRQGGRSSVTLPTAYVAEHVDLGYAITVHRAQGATVDTAHAIVRAHGMSRETLYVAMTRGRAGNRAYVIIDDPHLEEHQRPLVPDDALTVLRTVLGRIGAELAATETIVEEQELRSSIAQLAAEYETLAQAAQHERWAMLLARSGLSASTLEATLVSDSLGLLIAGLRRGEANGHPVDTLLPRLVAQRELGDALDPAAVLSFRLTAATAEIRDRGRARLIAGLIPRVDGSMPEEFRTALAERERLIEDRATALLSAATEERVPWLTGMGTPPAGARERRSWTKAARTVCAYRDRYGVRSPRRPLGDAPVDPRDWTELLDRHRASRALQEMERLAPGADTAGAARSAGVLGLGR